MHDEWQKHYSLDDNILYFLHIPKTAGTTFTFILDSYYNLSEIYPERVYSKLLQTSPTTYQNLKLIRGHFGFGIYRFLPKKPLYLTFFRDPIERTLSFYDHIRLDPYTNNWVNPHFITKEGLSELLDDKNKRKIFTNNQTRHIALDLDISNLVNLSEPKNIENFLFEEFPEFVSPKISEKDLIKTAKERLSKFAFIGLTERSEESFFLFCYTFELQPLGNSWKLMVAPNRTHSDDLDEDTINHIKSCNKLDTELYEFAKQLFEFRYLKMMEDFKNQSKNHQDEVNLQPDAMYEFLDQNYIKQQAQINHHPQDSINYNFNQKFNGRGWYYREFDPNSGKAFRWTGPDAESTIDFTISKTNDLQIQISVIKYVTLDILKSVQLFVNDNPIELNISQKNNKKTLEGIMPKGTLENERKFTRFSLKVKHTAEIFSSTIELSDTRKVGIALDNIKITPVE